MNSRVKEILFPTLALLIICLVTTALLGFTDNLTRDTIERVNEEIAQKSREQVCPDAASFEKMELESGAGVYKALDGSGNLIGFAISTASSGYGGDIKVMTGIDSQSGTVISINVYDNSNETPGLGANTSTEKFMSQYSGVSVTQGFIVNKNGYTEPKYPIDAVTGATISSTAVTNAVNEALDIYNNYCGEEG